MIIFFGGMEIAAIVIIFLAVVAGSAEMIIGLIDFLTVVFVIKNIVQTVIYGFIKNKNSLLVTAVFLATDIIRMSIFFTNLKSIGQTFIDAHGLRYFAALFGFILYFLICGGIFLVGEFLSLAQARGKEGDELETGTAMIGGIGTVLLLAFVTWLGYQ